MSVSTISNNTQSAAATSAANLATATPDSTTNPSSVLNQADFLKLLVAQIQYQDPMNPQSDTQMAAQMAQFTTLQQTTQSTSSLAMMQANSLIGSNVTVQVDDTHSTSGVVTGVVMNNGAPQVTVSNTNYNLSQVTAVTPPATTAATSTTATPTTGTAGTTTTATTGSAPTYSGTSSSSSQTNP